MATGQMLPPVITRLSMDTGRFDKTIAASKTAMASFRDTIRETDDALKDMSASLDADNRSITSMSRRLSTAAAAQSRFRNAVQNTNNALRAQAATGVAASIATAGGSGGSGARPWWWRLLAGNGVSLFSGAFATGIKGLDMWVAHTNLFHIALDGTMEAAFALVPAIIDLTGALTIMAPAGLDIANRMNAVATVNDSLARNMPGVTSGFKSLATQVGGPTVAAFGGLLNLFKGNGGAGAVFVQTADSIDGIVAKLDIWKAAQSGTNGMLQNGQTYLHDFAGMVQSASTAVAAFLRADPGSIGVLMTGITTALHGATAAFSFLAGNGIGKAVLAFHSFMLWGGLAYSQAAKLLGRLPLVGKAIQGAMANPYVAAGVALVALLAMNWNKASNGVEAYITAQNQALAKMSPMGALNSLPGQLMGVQGQIANQLARNSGLASVSALQELGHGLYTSNWGDIFKGLSQGVKAFFAGPSGGMSNNMQKLLAQYDALMNETMNLTKTSSGLVNQGYSVSQAFSLMAQAGVKSTDSFAVMRQKVTNLISGYQAMSISGNLLANSLNATSFAAEQQQSKISTVTSAWTAFMSTVTGSASAFDSFMTDFQGLGKVNFNSVTASAIKMQQSFVQSVNDGSNLINTLMTQASAAGLGARGTQLLTQAGKDMVATLAKQSDGSRTAVAMLSALAQQAGGPAMNSMAELSKWYGKADTSGRGLENIMGLLTGAFADLTKDVQNLSNVIASQLNAQLAKTMAASNNVAGAMTNAYNAITRTGAGSRQTNAAMVTLASKIMAVYGNTSAARNEFIALAERMGETATDAALDWQKMVSIAQRSSNAIQRAVDAIHDKTITVTVIAQGGGLNLLKTPGNVALPAAAITRNARGGYASGTSGARPGWAWVGELGPELVKFSGGERVIPSHVATGYAGGTGGDIYVESVVQLDGKEIFRGMQKQAAVTQRRTGHNGLQKRTR